MKYDLSTIDQSQFLMRAGTIAGQACVLVEPKKNTGITWTRENLILRSSIWTMEGELVSAGLPKFFNVGENPTLFPELSDLTGAEVVEKLDGSSLIISCYKGELIVRTRGTFDAHDLTKNGNEVEALIEEYKEFFDFCKTQKKWSFVAEWYSPTNKIVLNYGERPKLWLIAAISHEDYSLMSQDRLDRLAYSLKIGRPRRFRYNSFEEMKEAVKVLKGEEGYCVYSEYGQRIDKIKSPHYLMLHKLKSEVSTIDKLVDLWLELGEPKYSDFYNHISVEWDHEIAEYSKGEISKICDTAVKIDDVLHGMINFAAKQLAGLSRKEQAEKIFASYGKGSNRAAMVFHVIDGKGLTKEDKKKLACQFLAEKK